MDMSNFDQKFEGLFERYKRRPEDLAGYKKLYEDGKETARIWEESETTDAAPFDDLMSKSEMINHLVTVHKLAEAAGKAISLANGTKATKDELRHYHDRIHARQQAPDAELTLYKTIWTQDNEGGRALTGDFRLGGFPIPTVKHNHVVVMSEGVSAAAEAIRSNKPIEGGKTMTASERKLLSELINNDFGTLKQEMKAFAADALAAKLAEVNTEWGDKESKIPDYASEATNLASSHQGQLDALRARHREEERVLVAAHEAEMAEITRKASAAGIQLSTKVVGAVRDGQRTSQTTYQAVLVGKKDAIEAATAENKAFTERALLTLESQRLTAQRRVLVSGVGPEAAKFLDSIPTAKELMIKAAESSSDMKQINSNTKS